MKRPSKLPSSLTGITFDVPRFVDYIRPAGFLCDEPVCHAVFYYAMTARLGYEENELGFGVQYEGDGYEHVLWNHSNFRQQWETISLMYGALEADMVRHWPCVDFQFHAMGFEALPDEERYRFNRRSAIILAGAITRTQLLNDKGIITDVHRTAGPTTESDRSGSDSDIHDAHHIIRSSGNATGIDATGKDTGGN